MNNLSKVTDIHAKKYTHRGVESACDCTSTTNHGIITIGSNCQQARLEFMRLNPARPGHTAKTRAGRKSAALRKEYFSKMAFPPAGSKERDWQDLLRGMLSPEYVAQRARRHQYAI